eukprot:TRINITY_DN3563_c0_g1_i11.p1 TRINITY_DN3563_c0_g1~~TRINITY_DN3563_c0_g1_i11.p1  ORF type:complete len:239 (+),score=56.50 TRINITY_DN3563_c0_g1_i11:162-878(+)
MNFVIMSSLLVGSAFATAFSSSDSNSVAISLNGATLTDTDTKLIVLGRGASGYGRADADAEGIIPGYDLEVSESDAYSESYGKVGQDGLVLLQSATETEANGENAISRAKANEFVADVNKVGTVFSLGQSTAESFSQSKNLVSNTSAVTNLRAYGDRALVDTTADAEAEATQGRDQNQVVISESESESEGTAAVFDGYSYTRGFTEVDSEGLFAFTDADASSVANAAPLKVDISKIFS